MKWEVGDRLRILNASRVIGAGLRTGGVYDVISIMSSGYPRIQTDGFGDIGIMLSEMPFVERLPKYEYESSDTELGEPSADCNCVTLTEIAEELTDIKAMIGRLLKRGDTE